LNFDSEEYKIVAEALQVIPDDYQNSAHTIYYPEEKKV
jgi:hypothetical protein